MKITNLTAQQKNPHRVNVFVDGQYRFSLDIWQVSELGVRVGGDYSQQQLQAMETESQFGKVYARAVEYCLLRPHSQKEVRDYLWRKTRPTKRLARSRQSPQQPPRLVERPGVPAEIVERVMERLVDKGYIDDEKFANFWVENRRVRQGMSRRKLMSELQQKGIAATTIEAVLARSSRTDSNELAKLIAKKYARYADSQKLLAYLARQGFGYDDIRQALADYQTANDL